MDVVSSLVLLAALAPTIAVAHAGLKRSTGLDPIFRQWRAGLNGEPFVVLKLRTMTEARSLAGALLSDGKRLTPFGRAVRSLSIDELPQLINVLRDEMSLVGPRPLPVEYIALYTPREKKRLSVRPGVTGLAQISGRQRLPFTERLASDVWYVENWSLRLDLKIMVVTVPRLLRRSGIVLGQEVSDVDDRGFAALWEKQRPGEVD